MPVSRTVNGRKRAVEKAPEGRIGTADEVRIKRSIKLAGDELGLLSMKWEQAPGGVWWVGKEYIVETSGSVLLVKRIWTIPIRF